MRPIKLRAWSDYYKQMFYDFDDIIIGIGENDELFAGHDLDDGDFEELIIMMFTGLYDKNGTEIYYESDILLLPDKRKALLKFDDGQLEAYFADIEGFVLIDLDGVNNINSYNLSDCEVVSHIFESKDVEI